MTHQSALENTQSSLQPVLDLLNTIAAERKKGCDKVCEVLSLDTTISSLLRERENAALDETFGKLLEEVSKIVEKCAAEQSIAYWPFENFWGKPNEPKHSKMLAYFIDPKQGHQYGKDLLRELLKVCKKENLQVDDHCEVTNEKDHIDIVVKRARQRGEDKSDNNYNYTLIFENKIHGARDQRGDDDTEGQLDKYVEVIKNKGFDYKQIHVFYLPLRADKDPNSDDKRAILSKEVNYKKITFDNEILKWLEDMAGKALNLGKNEGMRDNLNHYKNLIRFLINQNKINSMKREIFEQIKKMAALPSVNQAERAQEAMSELVPYLQVYTFLKKVEDEILKQNPQTKCVDEFSRANGIAVGVKASNGKAIFWFVYDLEPDNDQSEDQMWIFAFERDDKNVQQPELFNTTKHWGGNENFPYLFASSEVIKDGDKFALSKLSQQQAQKVAKKLLDMAKSFNLETENTVVDTKA